MVASWLLIMLSQIQKVEVHKITSQNQAMGPVNSLHQGCQTTGWLITHLAVEIKILIVFSARPHRYYMDKK